MGISLTDIVIVRIMVEIVVPRNLADQNYIYSQKKTTHKHKRDHFYVLL